MYFINCQIKIYFPFKILWVLVIYYMVIKLVLNYFLCHLFISNLSVIQEIVFIQRRVGSLNLTL